MSGGHRKRGGSGGRSAPGAMDEALGLYTDLYELRMVESYLRREMTATATFSLYIRPTPERPWFVALGVQRLFDRLEAFRYGAAEIEHMRTLGMDPATLDWLGSFEFVGEVWAVQDGTVVLANEPILEVTALLPVAQLIETMAINVIQFSTLIATKAARVAIAARGRPVVDFGFRRAHGLDAGVEAALAAYVGGGLTTSNVEAGRRYGIGVVGTMAHSFVQAFSEEIDAFRAFALDHPDNCVLLVDTYDTLEGVRNAIVVAREMESRGARLRAIRIDSGDLSTLAGDARRFLDEANLGYVEVFASGGLDEYDVQRLVEDAAPIDSYGVGTDLVVSSDRPALDMTYKLVSYDGRGVAKHSEGKQTLPGAKQVFREGSPDGDVLGLRDEDLPGAPLLGPVWREGRRMQMFDVEEARERAATEIDALPAGWKDLLPRDACVPSLSDGLKALAAEAR